MPSLLLKNHQPDKCYTVPNTSHLGFYEPCNAFPPCKNCECIQQVRLQAWPEAVCEATAKAVVEQPKRTFWQSLFGEKKCCACSKRKQDCCCEKRKRRKYVQCPTGCTNVRCHSLSPKMECKCSRNEYSYSRNICHPNSNSICGCHFYIDIENYPRRPKHVLPNCKNEERNMVEVKNMIVEKIQLQPAREIKIEPNPPIPPLQFIELKPNTEIKPIIPPISPMIRRMSPTSHNSSPKESVREFSGTHSEAMNPQIPRNEGIIERQESLNPPNVHIDLTFIKETQVVEGTDCREKIYEECAEDGENREIEIHSFLKEEEENERFGSDRLNKRNSEDSSEKILTLEINSDGIDVQNNDNLTYHPIKNNESTVLEEYIIHQNEPRSESYNREILPLLEKRKKRSSDFVKGMRETTEGKRNSHAHAWFSDTDNKPKKPSLNSRVSEILEKLLNIEEKIEGIQKGQGIGKLGKDFKTAVDCKESTLSMHFKDLDYRKHVYNRNKPTNSSANGNIKSGTVIEIRQMKTRNEEDLANNSYGENNGKRSINLRNGQSKKNSIPKITIKLPKNTSLKVSASKKRIISNSCNKNNDHPTDDNDNYIQQRDNCKSVTWNDLSEEFKDCYPSSDPKCYCYECTYSRNRLTHVQGHTR